ncbi:SpoIID/LytB domain protein [Desulfitobacterium dichloroeliminans LMG P-21439]|uniref:SpoIID/LytB domain protein n=1 Tax=Desulfitobacterium dichloroeliminans (strain LMG P-21439 / DCA1) TaxID=871963 RepID=L0F9R3_DESDL|nr:SpoIID/LytB domain protein [Desulfitobacterium dichloroeliminans LMG P-21439]
MLPFSSRWPFRGLVFAFFFIATLMIQVSPCQAKEIEVELVWKFKGAGWVKIQIEQGNYLLKEVNKDASTSTAFPAGSSLELTWGGWSPAFKKNYDAFMIWNGKEIKLMRQGEYGSFLVQTPDGQRVSYRGSLSLRWEDGNCKLINRVDQEDYLKGVVPIEMSNSWAGDGLEALKAQAVAARTYMVRKTQNTTRITDSPDYDQAYLGRNVEGSAGRAVESTRGEILVDSITYQAIDALYSSHNGGYMELAENVWNNPDPHFASQPDPFSAGIGGPADRWRFIVGADVLGKAFELGPIAKIELDKLPSGRIKKVSMQDIYGKLVSVSGRALVQKFYPYGQPITSQAFLGNMFSAQRIPNHEAVFSLDQRVKGMPIPLNATIDSQKIKTRYSGPRLSRILSSSQGIRDFPATYDVFIFNGRGWGHGVGMSQWGAYHMAQRGYTYREILDFYYQQTDLIKFYL